MASPSPKYTMTISRLTVDKLGVKLYDKVSAVLAELVANSYDADATEVEIRAPMGQYLAGRSEGQVQDRGYCIEVHDNGIGMTPTQVNAFYLRVGAERRKDPQRGDVSKLHGRKVMGRKGVGKLAPFGICQRIEVITSGGDPLRGRDESGQIVDGYLTAHLVLEQEQIMSDSDVDYNPEPGPLDELVRPQTGTLLRLTFFSFRQVPSMAELNRQLAQRFGTRSADWRIVLIDSTKDGADPEHTQEIGKFEVPTMEGTVLRFKEDEREGPDGIVSKGYCALNPDDAVRTDIEGGFKHEGHFYPVTGWVAYAKENYKDDLMAGVRIYCRGKIAAQTSIFNLRSGFTGEYDVRSYIVGELHADWLDEEEDLIRTDRRDILWAHEVGQEFERWGQAIVKAVGKAARNPIKQKTWDVFKSVSGIEQQIREAFPLSDQQPIRDRALDFAKLFGKTMREEEVRDPEQAAAVVQLSLSLAPHVTLTDKLREAGDARTSPLAVMTAILRTARLAELSSYGRIADERIKVISRVEALKDDTGTLESVFQNLIEQAPWLIDPQWSPIAANQTLKTLRSEFAKYYKARTGQDIYLEDFSDESKRPDFVLSSQDAVIQIIEIKRPHHKLQAAEMERLNRYVDQMQSFLAEPSHLEFTSVFRGFHVTLVCDDEELSGVHKRAFDSLLSDGRLTYMSWMVFLAKTRRMHEEFLAEAERQRRDAAQRAE